ATLPVSHLPIPPTPPLPRLPSPTRFRSNAPEPAPHRIRAAAPDEGGAHHALIRNGRHLPIGVSTHGMLVQVPFLPVPLPHSLPSCPTPALKQQGGTAFPTANYT